ncbi:MAG: hypothetical protein ACP59X_20505 [Solidesulfovibrio sp. DCME]|uniref:hypothetical protein n=1 Tax=Solidesulfovibrio sp. DCME TaxID=3447380 RepID=UPI003D13981F
MPDIYPLAMHCRFEGFPARIRVTCGQAFAEARATPYSFGSRVDLVRTPQSGVLAGTLTPGQALPALEMIYSDTGADDAFDLKVAHYGYGRFYLAHAGDASYTLAVIKGLRVEATGIRRSFETVDVWDTLVPAEADLTDLSELPDAVILQDDDGTKRTSITLFVGDMPTGGLIVTGRLQLGGQAALQL